MQLVAVVARAGRITRKSVKRGCNLRRPPRALPTQEPRNPHVVARSPETI